MREEDARRYADENPCAQPHQRARSIDRACAETIFYGRFDGKPIPFKERLLYRPSLGALASTMP